MITWFPKSLMLQFFKAANVYFLIVTILTAMPFSPKPPESQFLTFAVVLFFTMLKEGYEVLLKFNLPIENYFLYISINLNISI
jgi:phospholipid-transporting ATPase